MRDVFFRGSFASPFGLLNKRLVVIVFINAPKEVVYRPLPCG